MRLVRVSWLDTVEHPSGWYDPEDIDTLEEWRRAELMFEALKRSEALSS